jgi:hypothetical protein
MRLVPLVRPADASAMSKHEAHWHSNGANIVGQNNWSAKGLRWTRSATRHRISRARSRYVIEHCRLHFWEESSSGAPGRSDPRFAFLGDDSDGVALEVLAVELKDENLLVIHAMQLRSRYRGKYEEAKKWRK